MHVPYSPWAVAAFVLLAGTVPQVLVRMVCGIELVTPMFFACHFQIDFVLICPNAKNDLLNPK